MNINNDINVELSLKLAANTDVFDIIPVCPLTNEAVSIPVRNKVWERDITTLCVSTAQFSVVTDDDEHAVDMLSEYITHHILNKFVQNHVEHSNALNSIDNFHNIICSVYSYIMRLNPDGVSSFNILVSQKMYDLLTTHFVDAIDIHGCVAERKDLPMYYGGKFYTKYLHSTPGIYVVSDGVDPDEFFQNNIMVVYRNYGTCTNDKIDDTLNGYMFAPYALVHKDTNDTYSTRYAITQLGAHPENNYISIKMNF